MEEIIKELAGALEKLTQDESSRPAAALSGRLQNGQFAWIADLPISVVQEKAKLKSTEARSYLEANGFFDAGGHAASSYSLSRLTTYCLGAKSAFQTIDLAAAEKEPGIKRLLFKSKRPNDYWKRLKNVETVRAMVTLERIDASQCSDAVIEKELNESLNGQWQVESRLRDAMRSKKENADLRSRPFIWVGVKERGANAGVDHIEMMLKHYFGEKVVHKRAETEFYIGFSDELNAVSLREFYKKA